MSKSVKKKPMKSRIVKKSVTKSKKSVKKPKRSAKNSAKPTRSSTKSEKKPKKSAKRSGKKTVRRTYRLGGPCKKETVDENWTKKSKDARLAILTEMFKDFSPVEAKCITLLQGINTHRTSEYIAWYSMYLIDDDVRALCDGDVVKVGSRHIDQNNGLDKGQT